MLRNEAMLWATRLRHLRWPMAEAVWCPDQGDRTDDTWGVMFTKTSLPIYYTVDDFPGNIKRALAREYGRLK